MVRQADQEALVSDIEPIDVRPAYGLGGRNEAALAALDSGHLHGYVSDFPTPELVAHPKVTALPHLGASTSEAEENCAIMVAENLKDYLENGNIRYSVNFPECRENADRLLQGLGIDICGLSQP